jgi:hypothetical protein
MKENTPEFAELAAFQAGGWQISTRRSEVDPTVTLLNIQTMQE